MNEAEDNLFEHVSILATGDGRAMGTAGHTRARKYLCALVKHIGLEPYSGQSYELVHNTGTEELVNVMAVAPGKNRHEEPILIGAHYDTFGRLPGADDNAAGIAITLEIASSLIQIPAACDVVIAFFDNEEFGYLSRESMGSTVFYREQCRRPVKAALIMDLVGHDVAIPQLEEVMFVKGMESSSAWSSILQNGEPENGLRWATFLNSYSNSPSDHYIYALNKDPYLYFSCGKWKHYHEATDTPEKLNYSKMAIFKNALLAMVRECAERKIARGEYDSSTDELHFLKKNILPRLGIDGFKFEARQDIDELYESMAKRFSIA